MKTMKIGLVLLVGWMAQAAQAVENTFLPFGVTIGKQAAVAKSKQALFGTIENPVAADAALKVDLETKSVIVNIFPCDEKGAPKPGAQPAIILVQGSNAGSLDKTFDKKKLDPGTYIANVVAG
ncbi:MAG: hypothetical protein AAF492_30960, partial [Verrucomicrobiota bacterium]